MLGIATENNELYLVALLNGQKSRANTEMRRKLVFSLFHRLSKQRACTRHMRVCVEATSAAMRSPIARSTCMSSVHDRPSLHIATAKCIKYGSAAPATAVHSRAYQFHVTCRHSMVAARARVCMRMRRNHLGAHILTKPN